MQFGEMVRERRRAAGVTVRALAAGSGLSESYIWRIERGKNRPTLEVAQRIAAALGCDVSDLYGNRRDDEVCRTQGERILLTLFRSLAPDFQAEAISYTARLAAGVDFADGMIQSRQTEAVA